MYGIPFACGSLQVENWVSPNRDGALPETEMGEVPVGLRWNG